ncbi:MAG: hypothetical protein ACI8Z7_000468 [Candidatus Nanohaloarchaea archaeon]|jgi:hypothetical protein
MEEHRCSECGKIFSEEELLERHIELEHGGNAGKEAVDKGRFSISGISRENVFGLILGVVLAVVLIAGFNYVNADKPVEVTVVTCGNCSYSEFRDSTGELFDVEYREVNYSSSEGQRLIEKYDLYYVPGFIFEKEVEDRENFTRIKSVVVEFDESYVLPDKGVTAAQRVSDGKSLDREHR